ncbi:10234_t:CDS:2 [Acaulospora morrowiae]|uniref:10234_t:CDS:1 n=1 Tax=Acaulospora morrowiae TaxID=94023 RepID=A0A9N9D4U7_9GLOM|nr:10234_t:CDS:2 [Acaulospora morrowiae]
MEAISQIPTPPSKTAAQQKQATVIAQSKKTSHENIWSQMMEEELGETSTSMETHLEEETHEEPQQTSKQQALERHQTSSFGGHARIDDSDEDIKPWPSET